MFRSSVSSSSSSGRRGAVGSGGAPALAASLATVSGSDDLPSEPGGPDDRLPAAAPTRAQALASQVKAGFGRLERFASHRKPSGPRRRVIVLVGFAAFVALTVLSFRSLPHGVHFHWWLLLCVIGVAAPLTVLTNAGEFRVMGAVNRHVIGWIPAIRLTVLAGVANLLPLPGGLIIRTQALRQRGSTYRHALAANAAAGLAWIGAGCLTIAVATLITAGTRLAGALLVVIGLGSFVGVLAILRRIDRATARRYLGQFILVETATVVVGAARIYLVFRMLGLAVSPVQAISLTAAGILSAAIGILPAGLGLREALAGVIGSAVDVSLSKAIAGTAADRITMQVTLTLLAGLVLLSMRRSQRRAKRDEPSESAQPARQDAEPTDAAHVTSPTGSPTG